MRIRFNTGRPKRSEPSREFAPHQRLDHRHARRVGVEAGQIGEIPAPRFDELPLAANRELFERFEAVGGEARREDRDALAGLAQGFEPGIGRGFEPFGAAETRLEGDRSEENTSELQSIMRLWYAVFWW